ncbi:branched-chain amino acid ABC transporter permease [Yinghuangia aomiensis]|uniref:Branched-chain amino acid ABC transporter permease n=1 Tax=Yinghuangia aomiensis TaxID=676205 RepID=A0ABP9I4D8_9ACTN
MGLTVWTDGLFAGAVYALVALGLAIVYQPTHVVNFAQGEALVLGAVVGYEVLSVRGWGWGAAIAIAIAAGAALGLLQERAIMLPVRLSGSRFAWIIATLAVALILQSLYLINESGAVLRPEPLVDGAIRGVAWQKLVVIGAAVAVTVGYDVFLRRSAFGRAVRATAYDPGTAALMAVPVRGVVVFSFAVSCAITAFAGLLAAPALFVGPADGLQFAVKGFIAAVIGGVGSPRGALAGGLVVGLLDSFVAADVDASIGGVLVYGVLGILLIAFPTGLMGTRTRSH